MKNILIIGNKGKLLNTIYSQLISENKFEVSILYFDIVESRFLNNVDIFNSEYDIREINVIIYCGGEVRDRSHMLNRNYIIPKIIVDYCIEEKITFYYLSSLSVYEYFFQNIEISELSIRNAKINYYGITKKLLDDYVELNSNILNYAILKPASIIGSKRLSSSLDKIIKIFIKYKFLK